MLETQYPSIAVRLHVCVLQRTYMYVRMCRPFNSFYNLPSLEPTLVSSVCSCQPLNNSSVHFQCTYIGRHHCISELSIMVMTSVHLLSLCPLCTQEPLNAVAGNTHERGSTGGFFNSSTHLRALPLSSSIHRSPVVHRGTRVMMLHGDRFLPRMRTVSDSALRISMPSTQNQRLSACEQRVAQSRFVKDLLCDPPHRLNFGYYMQGQTLPLSNVVGLSDKERERLQLATARNNDLYYGKGIRSVSSQHCSSIL